MLSSEVLCKMVRSISGDATIMIGFIYGLILSDRSRFVLSLLKKVVDCSRVFFVRADGAVAVNAVEVMVDYSLENYGKHRHLLLPFLLLASGDRNGSVFLTADCAV